MKHTFKNFFCILLSSIICFSSFSITSFAADENSQFTESENGITSRSTILSDVDVLANSTKTLIFNVPESTTYTFTMVVSQIYGSGGVWAILQKSGSGATLDKVITGSYQKRFNLTSGTWYLQLTSAPGTAAYSVTIHKTF